MSPASSIPASPRTKASLYIQVRDRIPDRSQDWYGAIAQLGERLHGMQEVSGSIPLGSTNSRLHHRHKFCTAIDAGIGGAKRP